MGDEKERDEKKTQASPRTPAEESSSSAFPYDEPVVHKNRTPKNPHERSASSLPIPKEVLPLSEDPSRCMNQYVLVEEIGRGGMGAVWRSWDTKLIRWVAVKFLSSTNEQSIRRFEREAQLSAQLRHSNIASVHDVNKNEGRYYLVMDYIDGPSIGQAELSGNPLLEVFIKICRAVHYAHERSIIHRDIKPENILMGKDGEPYVTDFGLAKVLQTESSLSMTGSILGTPVFMSPEQAEGIHSELDARSDVYSLGATLYALLTGHAPFEGEDMTTVLEKLALEDPTPPTDLNPRIAPELEAILMKAMTKEKSARYSSAEAFALDIENFLQDNTVEAKKPGPIRPLLRKLKRRRWQLIAVMAILLAGGVWIFWPRTSPPPAPENGGKASSGEAKWLGRWKTGQKELSFYGFESSSPGTVGNARKLLSEMPGEAEPEVARWFMLQLNRISPEKWPKSRWMEKRSEAKRIGAWCGMIVKVLEGREGDFVPVLGQLREELSRFAPIAGYRGAVVLRVVVWPYAELRSLRVEESWMIREGKVVSGDLRIPGGSLFTPLEIRGLEIGDFTLVLHHQELGEREITLAADQLRHGGVYVCSGSLAEPESIRLHRLP